MRGRGAGPHEGGLEGQAGGDGEGGVQAAEDGAEQHELADAHVDGQAGQVVAQGRQHLAGRQRAQVLQTLLRRLHAGRLRGLDEAGEDRGQGAVGEQVQDLDPGRGREREGCFIVLGL